AGASLQGGAMDLDLDVDGPVERLVTTGPITVSNTKLAAFDLGSKMAVVAAFAGVPRSVDTAIQRFSSTLRVAPNGIRADALELIVPTIGRLTGSGTVGASGALDFKMLAQLAGSSGIAGTVSRVTTLGHPESGMPFLVAGTTSSPTFAPDLSATIRGAVNKENAAK